MKIFTVFLKWSVYSVNILYVSNISITVNAFLVPHIEMLINQGHSVDVACKIVQEVDHPWVTLAVRFMSYPLVGKWRRMISRG